MKIFFRRLIVFLSIAFLGFVLLELLLRTFPNTYDIKQNLIAEKSSEIEVLFLGTSHVFSGIRPGRMDFQSVNLANNSQSLYYDIQIVKSHLNSFSNLKAIVFEINFFSFYYNLDLGPESWRNTFYHQSFGIKPQTEELSWLDLSRLVQLKRNEIILLLQSQKQNKIYFKELGFGGVEDDRKFPSQESAQKKFNSFSQDYINSDDAKVIQDLLELIMHLKSANVDVYFLRFPASSHLTSYIEESDYLDRTDSVLDSLFYNLGAKELDYFGDHHFDDDLFYDSDHLNMKGANLLTGLVNEAIKVNTFE